MTCVFIFIIKAINVWSSAASKIYFIKSFAWSVSKDTINKIKTKWEIRYIRVWNIRESEHMHKNIINKIYKLTRGKRDYKKI